MKNVILSENKPLTSIRGIAALWVVGHHWLVNSRVQSIQTVFGDGYRAVDIFFVLSGLILAMVYSKLRLDSASRFMANRIFRVYPLHITCLLLLAIVVQIPNFHAKSFLSPEFVGSMLLLQPFIHLNTATNPVAWSIGIELVFYLLFPFILIILQKIQRRAEFISALPLMLCALFFIQFYEVHTRPEAQFGVDALQRGIVSFVLGMALAQFRTHVSLSAAIATAIESAACIAIGVAIALHKSEYVPGIAAALIFSLSFDVGKIAKIMHNKIMVWLGQISFSIYLLHYPIQVAMNKIPFFDPSKHAENTLNPLHVALLMIILLIISTMSYHYIEMPCRKIPARISNWITSLTAHRQPTERPNPLKTNGLHRQDT